MSIQSVNPATGLLLERFAAFDEARVERSLADASDAYRRQRSSSFADHAAKLEAKSDIQKTKDAWGERLTALGSLLSE